MMLRRGMYRWRMAEGSLQGRIGNTWSGDTGVYHPL
jgi:hypothetical protein